MRLTALGRSEQSWVNEYQALQQLELRDERCSKICVHSVRNKYGLCLAASMASANVHQSLCCTLVTQRVECALSHVVPAM